LLHSVSLSLETNYWIGFQVTHVDCFALREDIWMFPNQKPAHVGEEKPSGGVMGVGVCIGEFVMDAMVACPFVYTVLETNRLEDAQKDLER
jgi:hypothetical protein